MQDTAWSIAAGVTQGLKLWQQTQVPFNNAMVGDTYISAARKHTVRHDAAFAITKVVSGRCSSSTLHGVQKAMCANIYQQRPGMP